MKTLLSVICLAVVSTVVVTAQDSPYSFKESYELGSPAQVMVSSSDGNIDVVAFDGNKTDVFYIAKKNNKVLSISRAELEKELTLEVSQVGNSLTIVVKYKDGYGTFDWKDKIQLDFRLQVPRETACDLRTSDGNVSIKGLTRDQKIKTSDGNLSIEDIRGSVIGSTSDGNVNVRKVIGSVDVKTSDGNVHVEEITGNVQSSTSDGNVSLNKLTGNTSAKTSDGDISFRDLAGSLVASTSDGNVTGNLVQLKTELNIRTSDGNISVSIPAKLGLDLNIKGESLSVPLDNFSGRSDEKVIQGKSNGGGIPVSLSTSGNVSLNYR